MTDVTRAKDFLRAGLAHGEMVTDSDGKPVMIGKGRPNQLTNVPSGLPGAGLGEEAAFRAQFHPKARMMGFESRGSR